MTERFISLQDSRLSFSPADRGEPMMLFLGGSQLHGFVQPGDNGKDRLEERTRLFVKVGPVQRLHSPGNATEPE